MEVPVWMQWFEYAARVLPRAQDMPYAALCFECTPIEGDRGPLPMVSPRGVVRDTWAAQHAAISGHTVQRYNLRDDGSLHCPAEVKPPTARRRVAPSKENRA